ncbi:Uma2 family endonuclease [Baaleninema simplex]|uniref:Uma2 family endonuclease n=1 Tax=Baaleninema simplex TaxID=2862350 RepID=UPI00034CF33A|nr:Uma2 family endonuclease [Baaleninema simplex]
MIAQPDRIHLTPEEYLTAERDSPIKHEYHDGEVRAMAGASDNHNLITGNLYTVLRSHLRGSPCQTFFADMKVRVETHNRFYYPDLLVTCDSRDRDTRYYKQHPKLIVEILSESTEAFDRGDKFQHYRQLESLEEYILVSQTHPAVDVFRRTGDRTWEFQPYTVGETVCFASLELECAIATIYEDVTFVPPAAGAATDHE